MAALLEVEKLTVIHQGDRGSRRVLEGVDFRLGDGDTLGLVGESGSGKSVLLSAITGLLSPPWRITAISSSLMRTMRTAPSASSFS